MVDIRPRKAIFNPELRRRGIYVVPNALTTAALLCGFLSIIQAMRGNFEMSAVAIFASTIFDGLDGRIARLTHTQSAFGAEYDSLSDMVSFGVAPSLVMFQWVLKDIGRWGWIAAFLYCAAAALRLARFNTMLDVIDKRFFQGLPSPAAAALVGGFVWWMNDQQVNPLTVQWVAFAITLFAGISMISSVRYYSFKGVNLKKSVSFITIAVILAGFALVSVYPQGIIFVLVSIYGLSGYVQMLWRFAHRRSA